MTDGMRAEESGGSWDPATEVSVVVCTRNRPESLVRTLRSLLASEDVRLDIVVVDQSDVDSTAAVRDQISPHGHVRHVRVPARGVGAALGEGCRLARSPYIVRTDDDCEVPPGWVAGMAEILRSRPKVGVVFSNVLAAPHDPRLGYTPSYERNRDRILHTVFATCAGKGLGAGMAVRREALDDIGGFDEYLGPGSRYQSSEDWDLELRALLRGWDVFHSSELAVVHHGFRSFAEGRAHAGRDWYAIGATFAKLVRAGHPSAFVLAAWQLGIDAVLPPIGDLVHLRRPRGLRRITSFFQGFGAGLAAPVNRRTMRFSPVPASAPQSPPSPALSDPSS